MPEMCGVIVGQHVVAGEERSVLRVVQAEVIGRVTRRVHDEPLAVGELEHVAVLDRMRDHRNDRVPDPAQHAPLELREQRRAGPLAAPGRAVAEPALRRLARGGLRRVGAAALRLVGLRLVGRARSGEILDRNLGQRARRHRRSEAEAAVGDHRGARFLREARRAAEVIRVRVRDDHGVYVADLEPGLAQAILDRAPGAGARKPGIDDGGALRVEDRVAVHVPESGHADRELHAQHVRRDLADLRTRGFLFLSACHGGAR